MLPPSEYPCYQQDNGYSSNGPPTLDGKPVARRDVIPLQLGWLHFPMTIRPCTPPLSLLKILIAQEIALIAGLGFPFCGTHEEARMVPHPFEVRIGSH